MQIIKYPTEELWWEIAQKCPYATFFHTPIWHELILKTYPEQKSFTLGFEFENGEKGILPLIGQKRTYGNHVLRSTFAGCYGGMIAEGYLDEVQMQLAYDNVCGGRITHLHLTGNPLSEPFEISSAKNVEDFTHILQLDGSFEALFSNFSKGHRSSTKKGQRMGVTVEIAQTLDEYRAYYGAYEDSIRRWGENVTSEYPWELFENGYYLSIKYPDQIKLWVAKLSGKIIAGAWVFYWQKHVDWWHGAAYEDYFDYCANNVLQAVIIEDALDKGYQYYDFNPSGGHEGVARFKKRFGAQKVPIKIYRFVSKPVELIRRLKS